MQVIADRVFCPSKKGNGKGVKEEIINIYNIIYVGMYVYNLCIYKCQLSEKEKE